MGIDEPSRAQGCLLGKLACDALKRLVEFQSLDDIRHSSLTGPGFRKAGGQSNG